MSDTVTVNFHMEDETEVRLELLDYAESTTHLLLLGCGPNYPVTVFGTRDQLSRIGRAIMEYLSAPPAQPAVASHEPDAAAGEPGATIPPEQSTETHPRQPATEGGLDAEPASLLCPRCGEREAVDEPHEHVVDLPF